jgi:hypothetical protein
MADINTPTFGQRWRAASSSAKMAQAVTWVAPFLIWQLGQWLKLTPLPPLVQALLIGFTALGYLVVVHWFTRHPGGILDPKDPLTGNGDLHTALFLLTVLTPLAVWLALWFPTVLPSRPAWVLSVAADWLALLWGLAMAVTGALRFNPRL